jgi:hypothetical protein
MAFAQRKGGSSRARAARARQGHAKRRGKLFAVSGQTGRAHYKGHPRKRTKGLWAY